MNQLTVVAYPPGAYGSFLCWAIERFSKHRTRHQPAITDNPLLPDGSSHAYASFCKVKGVNDFIDGMNKARINTKPWRTAIYAGWPCNPMEDINANIDRVLDSMMPYDKLIYVDTASPQDTALCYLRNEATLDKSRWYAMLEIEQDSQLTQRMKFDIDAPKLNPNKYDPRMLVLSLHDILVGQDLWARLSQHLAWPMIDHDRFHAVLDDMRDRQDVYYEMMSKASSDGTPTQRAIYKYQMEIDNGIN